MTDVDADVRASEEASATVQAKSGALRRQATRSQMVDAAKRLLDSGASVAGLSVGAVVKEAGVSRATYYLHFADKRELVVALAEDLFSWRDYIGAEVLANPDLDRQSLDEMLRLIVARWSDNRVVLAAIIEVAEYDEELGSAWRDAMGRIADTAAVQLEERWRRRGDRSGDPRVIAEIFTWMFERSCHQMLRSGAAEAELADAMGEIIWRTISSPTSAD